MIINKICICQIILLTVSNTLVVHIMSKSEGEWGLVVLSSCSKFYVEFFYMEIHLFGEDLPWTKQKVVFS